MGPDLADDPVGLAAVVTGAGHVPAASPPCPGCGLSGPSTLVPAGAVGGTAQPRLF